MEKEVILLSSLIFRGEFQQINTPPKHGPGPCPRYRIQFMTEMLLPV